MLSACAKRLRVLDFDIENRPLSYLGHDFTTAEVTAICASWAGSHRFSVWLLGDVDMGIMLAGFRALYDEADVVTGHYIRRHDLPILNSAMVEAGLPPLSPKLASDTKLDLVHTYELSMSQESLAGIVGVRERKEHVTQPEWRRANRLEGLDVTERRVVGDVRQHKAMRAELIRRGLLGPPTLWSPWGAR